MHEPAMSLLVVATAILAILLAGCSDEPTPTPISTPADAPAPTSTATPTAEPTPTPTPTAEPPRRRRRPLLSPHIHDADAHC